MLQASIDVAGAIADMPPMLRMLAYRDVVSIADHLDGLALRAALQVAAEVTTLLREFDVIAFPVAEVEYV